MENVNYKLPQKTTNKIVKGLCILFFSIAILSPFVIAGAFLVSRESQVQLEVKPDLPVEVEHEVPTAFSYTSDKIVSVSRSFAWKPDLYTAVLMAEQQENGSYDVNCNIHISPDSFYMVKLGESQSLPEILGRWGKLIWTSDTLVIGKRGSYRKKVSRNDIEESITKH